MGARGGGEERRHPNYRCHPNHNYFVRKLLKITLQGFPGWVIVAGGREGQLASKITICRGFPYVAFFFFSGVLFNYTARALISTSLNCCWGELRVPRQGCGSRSGQLQRWGAGSPLPTGSPLPGTHAETAVRVRLRRAGSRAGTHRCPASRSGAAGKCWPAGRAERPPSSTSHPWGCSPARAPGPSSPPAPAQRSRRCRRHHQRLAAASACARGLGRAKAPGTPAAGSPGRGGWGGRERGGPRRAQLPMRGMAAAPRAPSSPERTRSSPAAGGGGGSRSASSSGPGSAAAAAGSPPPPLTPPSLRLERVRRSPESEKRHSSAPSTD